MAFRYFCQGKHGVFAMVILTIPGGPSMDPFGHFWLQRSATKIEKLMRVKFDAMDDIFLKIYASYTSYIHDFVANLDDVVTCHATKRLMHPFKKFLLLANIFAKTTTDMSFESGRNRGMAAQWCWAEHGGEPKGRRHWEPASLRS